MTKLSSFKEASFSSTEKTEKIRKAVSKINSLRDAFEKKKKERTRDLEEARRVWREVSKEFGWWQSQSLP